MSEYLKPPLGRIRGLTVGFIMVADQAVPSNVTREMETALLLVESELVMLYCWLVTMKTGFGPPFMYMPASWNWENEEFVELRIKLRVGVGPSMVRKESS